MLDKLLSVVAPHYCSGCAEIGSILCQSCRYDIIDDHSFDLADGTRAVGAYKSALGLIIKGFKFERRLESARVLASIMHNTLPYYDNVVVIPVPTIDAHIRQRGYDHMGLIAREFARLRGYQVEHSLKRVDSRVQVGSSSKLRREQAMRAFRCDRLRHPDSIYLVVDDVLTTGATLKYASRAIRKAGAKRVIKAVIAH